MRMQIEVWYLIFNSNQTWIKNLVDVSVKNEWNMRMKKIWDHSKCGCEIDKYLISIIGDSAVTCIEITDMVTKSYDKPTNFDLKKATCKIETLHISFSSFYLPYYYW